MKKAFILDSDLEYLEDLRDSLSQDGYEVDIETEGTDALCKVTNEKYDLFIFNMLVPDVKVITLCEEIRDISDSPIIIASEKDEDIDKILALEQGADDYIVKPFNFLELKARIKSIFRRIGETDNSIGSQNVRIGNFQINILGRKIELLGKEIDLTGKEFDLFMIFISNPGRVFDRKELLEKVWGYSEFGDGRTVDVHVRRLREKIEGNPKKNRYIKTKWGTGYYFGEI